MDLKWLAFHAFSSSVAPSRNFPQHVGQAQDVRGAVALDRGMYIGSRGWIFITTFGARRDRDGGKRILQQCVGFVGRHESSGRRRGSTAGSIFAVDWGRNARDLAKGRPSGPSGRSQGPGSATSGDASYGRGVQGDGARGKQHWWVPSARIHFLSATVAREEMKCNDEMHENGCVHAHSHTACTCQSFFRCHHRRLLGAMVRTLPDAQAGARGDGGRVQQ